MSEALYDWSNTGGSNQPDSGDAATVQADLQAIQAGIRGWLAHKGSDIASVAGTTDIGAVEGLAHDITGTEVITGLGTVSAGIWKILKFEAAATLTHNATSLILPGAANIVTANGDIGIFISEGSGNWRCVSYTKATGAAVLGASVGSSLVLIGSQQTASDSATIDFESGITSTYDEFLLVVQNAVPATDAAALGIRVSVDAGANYAAADYQHSVNGTDAGGTARTNNSVTATQLSVTGSISNTGAEGGASMVIHMVRPHATAIEKHFHGSGFYSHSTSDAPCSAQVAGISAETSPIDTVAGAINAVQFLMSSGNIASGTFALYGVRKS